jgi:hypothetical protein
MQTATVFSTPCPLVVGYNNYQAVEKVIFFRLVKNIQMQGARNPEE